MRSVRIAVGTLTAAFLLLPGLSAAAELQLPGPSAASAAQDATMNTHDASLAAAPQPTVEPLAEPQAPTVLAGFGKPVGSDTLADIRGGAEVVINDMRLAGVVADNTANRVITGSNAITDGAFANASGLPTVIQNTGANTLIQNATILNVRFGP